MDRIKNCEQKFNQLFNSKPVNNEGTDPEFMRILQRFIFGEVCYVGLLDNRMRELITITVLTVNQTLPQLAAHTKACLNIGVSPIEIRETVYQCAPFIGFPKTLNAIAAINEVFSQNGIALPLKDCGTVSEDSRYDMGLQIQKPLYGEEIADRYNYLPEPFDKAIPYFLTSFCFGDFFTREGLLIEERHLLTIIILAAMGGAENQVYSHIEGALKAGIDKEQIICALLHAMPYMGIPRLFNAINCAKDLLS